MEQGLINSIPSTDDIGVTAFTSQQSVLVGGGLIGVWFAKQSDDVVDAHGFIGPQSLEVHGIASSILVLNHLDLIRSILNSGVIQLSLSYRWFILTHVDNQLRSGRDQLLDSTAIVIQRSINERHWGIDYQILLWTKIQLGLGQRLFTIEVLIQHHINQVGSHSLGDTFGKAIHYVSLLGHTPVTLDVSSQGVDCLKASNTTR